ncbi:uncharacterized protein BJ212DRAFT_1286325, partial [Suillus subaureus]
NYWNLYTGYFKDWMHQELVRLGNGAPPQDGTGVCHQCYELFKKSYPDTYQDILNTYGELDMLTDNQTIAQCTQSFQKLYKRVGSIVSNLIPMSSYLRCLI